MRYTILLSLLGLTLVSCTKETSLTDTNNSYFDLVRPSFSGDVAMETTAFVEKFWRVAGNTGFNESVKRIVTNLEEAGYVLEDDASSEARLVYRIQTRQMDRPTWEPVRASLGIVGNDEFLLSSETNRNMVFLNSVSTPEGGITGAIVHIQDVEDFQKMDVSGKIVFAEMSPYKIYKPAIMDGGAIGIITYNNPAYLQPEKNQTSIQFRRLPYREEYPVWGIALSYAAKEKLMLALAAGSVSVKVDIETKMYPSEELTVIADVRGSEIPDESLVFSAHIQEPGANDNATGVGTQLEMAMVAAELIKNNEIEARRTLTFLWGDEIISTKRYIEEEDKRTADISWGISLDMVGENTDITGGTFLIEKMPDPSAIWTRGNDKHSEWGGDVLAVEDMTPHYLNDFIISVFKEQGEFANWVVNTNPFEGGSDHTPFLRADIPGLLLWHFTDQFYHTDNDRIDKVSQTSMTNVGVGALVSALTLINADEQTAFQMISAIKEAATIRLREESELSIAALQEGSTREKEELILATWKDWYQKTLDTVTDLTQNPSESLAETIVVAQADLEKLNDELVSGW